jgi:hypothetical protein
MLVSKLLLHSFHAVGVLCTLPDSTASPLPSLEGPLPCHWLLPSAGPCGWLLPRHRDPPSAWPRGQATPSPSGPPRQIVVPQHPCCLHSLLLHSSTAEGLGPTSVISVMACSPLSSTPHGIGRQNLPWLGISPTFWHPC